MSDYEYINKVTNKKIDSSSLLLASRDGVIESLGGTALRYTPGNLIDTRIVNADSGYPEAVMPQMPGQADISAYDSAKTEYKHELVPCRKYIFGINSIMINRSTPNKTNGFISKEIDLNLCSYIELSVSVTGNANVEYSILDGVTETPILPVEQKSISEEKIFPGLATRFKPDISKPIVIYKDGKKTNITYAQLNSLDADGSYSISYTPEKLSHIYYPQNKKIKIKVVQRCSENAPATIKSLVILKHGGDTAWNM